MAATCKKCDARIMWALVKDTTKPIPIDPVPNEAGQFLVWSANPDLPMEARRVGAGEVKPGTPRFTAHTDTCPKAEPSSRPWQDSSDPGPREP